jgi:hypothetical protein
LFQRIYKIPLSAATDDRRKKKRDYPMQADNPLKGSDKLGFGGYKIDLFSNLVTTSQ